MVLDQNRNQLIDSLNSNNKVYTNEELSTIVTTIQSTLLDKTYPIGSIYISYSNINPNNLFGGTWVAFGSGRTLVGVNTSDSSFNTVEKTGGEKTHTLTINEMPSHEGHYVYWGASQDGYYLSTPRLIELGIMVPYSRRRWNIIAGNELNFDASNLGGGQAHNNLQPYITVYMWKRTA